MEPKTTSWVVVGLGVVVSIIGQMSRPGGLGAGILEFRYCHSSWESWICLDPQSDGVLMPAY